ncbi:hypothetical protein AAGV28_06070 [Flavobacterium sp. FZUC8N2.13]|uniref:RteC protein n=1 Tax=Flavobacterium zubiriense TaxID=3138075 RepID=A0ABV4TAA4_9FLAO
MSKILTPEEIEFQRETYKIGLETFTLYLKQNTFDDSIGELIKKLQNELNEEIENYIEIQYDSKNAGQVYSLDIEYLEDRLLALTEMNIVYVHKDFEINLKKLIKASYNVNTKEFYKWENVINFLKSKNIKYAELTGYKEINELRIVNNSIKHSTSLIDEKVKKITEFKELKYMSHNELIWFFKRVKDFPYKFISELSSEIYKDLYQFDENRLDKIAELYALRMDKKNAERFKELLKLKY